MVNNLAVVVAAVAGMVLGGFWYSPLLFGKRWMKLMDMDKKKYSEMKKQAKKSYLINFVAVLITAYVLGRFIDMNGNLSAGGGASVGFLAWLGFVATIQLGGILWEGKPWKLWVLNSGYHLVSFLVMGIILGIWA